MKSILSLLFYIFTIWNSDAQTARLLKDLNSNAGSGISPNGYYPGNVYVDDRYFYFSGTDGSIKGIYRCDGEKIEFLCNLGIYTTGPKGNSIFLKDRIFQISKAYSFARGEYDYNLSCFAFQNPTVIHCKQDIISDDIQSDVALIPFTEDEILYQIDSAGIVTTWISDGTPQNTRKFKMNLYYLYDGPSFQYKGYTIFTRNQKYQPYPLITDFTELNTYELKDFLYPILYFQYIDFVSSADDALYLSGDIFLNGVKFTRTVAIVDDIPYIFNIGYLLAVYPIGDKVIFHTESQGIFSFDKLTKELIKIVPNTRRSFVVSTHDKVFFTYYTLNKYQLWVTDGTFEGSKIIDPLISHVGQGFNVAYDGKETIFYTRYFGELELWTANLNTGIKNKLLDFNGANSTNFGLQTAILKDRFYFGRYTQVLGLEWWVIDYLNSVSDEKIRGNQFAQYNFSQREITFNQSMDDTFIQLDLIALNGNYLYHWSGLKTEVINISILHLPPGVYYCRINQGGKGQTLKILIH
ncbi:MAG: hypothetical protein IPH93_10175 [Saprospiraceae bacterium]|nr:hypothetical protein [Saprospiraceae bacterium]